MIDVLRRDGAFWRYVCLIDRCGYSTRLLTETQATRARSIHRHRRLVGTAPIPWQAYERK